MNIPFLHLTLLSSLAQRSFGTNQPAIYLHFHGHHLVPDHHHRSPGQLQWPSRCFLHPGVALLKSISHPAPCTLGHLPTAQKQLPPPALKRSCSQEKGQLLAMTWPSPPTPPLPRLTNSKLTDLLPASPTRWTDVLFKPSPCCPGCFLSSLCLSQWFSGCGPQTSSTGLPSELVSNACSHSQGTCVSNHHVGHFTYIQFCLSSVPQ